MGARLGERLDVGGRVPDASRRELIVNGAAPAKNSALTSADAELRLAKRRFASGEFDVDELKLQAETASEPAPCPV